MGPEGETLYVRPGRSALLPGVVTGLAAAAMITLALLDLPLWQRLLLSLWVIAWLFQILRLHHWRTHPDAVIQARWLPESGWRLTLASGGELPGRLRPGGWWHPWLLVLPFHCSSPRRAVLVLPRDGVDPEVARRLRRLLRSTAGRGAQAAPGGT